MSIPALAHDSSLRIANESTYGTAPGSATSKMDMVEWEIDPNLSTIPDVNMNSSGASPRAIGKGLQFVTGRLRWRAGYEGDEEIWRWVLGTYARTTVGGETIVFDHAFKEIK